MSPSKEGSWLARLGRAQLVVLLGLVFVTAVLASWLVTRALLGDDTTEAALDTTTTASTTTTTSEPTTTTAPTTTTTQPRRVVESLVALYRFDEGGGTVIANTVGPNGSLDLQIGSPSHVSWGQSSLLVEGPAEIMTPGPAIELNQAIRAAGQLTVEAWVQPADEDQDGPARIVTVSDGKDHRNITLAQDDKRVELRLRTTETGDNGDDPRTRTGNRAISTELTHLVATWVPTEGVSIYVDGELRETKDIEGDLSTWDPNYALALADETTGDREWLGALHLVAIYARALSPEEIALNLSRGPTG